MLRKCLLVICLMSVLPSGALCETSGSKEPQQASPTPKPQDAVLTSQERTAGFVRLWSEVKYNFAFFEQAPEVDWDKVLDEYLPKVQAAQSDVEYYRLLQRCIASLKDGHTTVYLPGSVRKEGALPLGPPHLGA